MRGLASSFPIAAQNRLNSEEGHLPLSLDQGTPPASKGSLSVQDAEGIALLRQIFPDSSDVELFQMHQNHVRNSAKKTIKKDSQKTEPLPQSKLGQRIWNETLVLASNQSSGATGEKEEEDLRWRSTELADDFLRLPSEVAVRRHNPKLGKWEYHVIDVLEKQVLEHHRAYDEMRQGQDMEGHSDSTISESGFFSRVVHRNATNGLGMSLCEQNGRVWIHSLIGDDGSRWFVQPPEAKRIGGAIEAGILPGDWVLGINGQALVALPSTKGRNYLLQDAVSTIHYSPDPVILHLHRGGPMQVPFTQQNSQAPSIPLNSTSLLDTTAETFDDVSSVSDEESRKSNVPVIHPFIKVLAGKGLILTFQEQVETSNELQQYTNRARQWETFSSFRIDSKTGKLRIHFDEKDLPPALKSEALSFDDPTIEASKPFTPSTPTLDPNLDEIPLKYTRLAGDGIVDLNGFHLVNEVTTENQQVLNSTAPNRLVYPASKTGGSGTRRNIVKERLETQNDIFMPLVGVRKSLSVRILNTFLDGSHLAYACWCYDVESGREWYSPVRYLRDFYDLRASTLPLLPSLAQIPFPNSGWTMFGKREASEGQSAREEKCRQLEYFLRTLCSVIYTANLHPRAAEIAIHVQSFLGCEVGLGDTMQEQQKSLQLRLQSQIATNEAMFGHLREEGHTEVQMQARVLLKQAFQRYTFRLFLLDKMQKIVNQFVDQTRMQGPKLQDIESLEAKGRTALKDRGLHDLEQIQSFLDQIQTMIIDGCMVDFESIAERRDYMVLHTFMTGGKGKAYLENLIRDAVREQTEIEVYVPLRSVVSRLLVNGWRHDDMEIHFKMRELRKRSQSSLRIPEDKQSMSRWSSVASILSEGVGTSTLPCAKLRAIVDAAKEISRVFDEEHQRRDSASPLGADDFLPIFIYCVVHANIEHPCALCILLQTLCEPTKRLGEVGYYLTSFASAVTHIQETDLNELG